MSLISDIQAYNLGFAHQTGHVLQDEAEKVVFEKLQFGTNAPVDLFTVETFKFSDRRHDGGFLPPDVQVELQIHEDLLTMVAIAGASSVKHGSRRYQMARPLPLPPTAEIRFWRFWLVMTETV